VISKNLSKFLKLIVAGLLVLALIGGCKSSNNGDEKSDGSNGKLSGKLALAGSTTVQPLAEAAAEEFMGENPGVQVTVQGGGSSVGVESVSKGTVDIGNASRDLKDEEKDLGLEKTEIAWDAVAIIVHPSIGVKDLDKDQVKDIFTGKITNWKEVGGKDQRIQIVNRDEASGTRECFFERALDKEEFEKNAIIQPGNSEMVATVAKTPNGIGYCSLGYIDDTVKAVKYEGVEASEKMVKNGEYKIARKLFMFTKGTPSKLAKAFFDFVLGKDFQEGTLSEKFIPII